MVFDITKPAGCKDGDTGDPRRIALSLTKQRPWVAAGTLGDAEAEFARMSLSRFIGNPGNHLKHVSQNEPHRTADRCVGPVARTEKVHIGVHADIVSDGTADDQEGRRAAGTGCRPVKVEFRLVHRLERGGQDREIFRQASGHDGIDRGGMHRQLQPGGGVSGDHRLRWPPFVGKRRLDPVEHGRNDRQAIGPTLLVAVIEGGQDVVRNFVDPVGNRMAFCPRSYDLPAVVRFRISAAGTTPQGTSQHHAIAIVSGAKRLSAAGPGHHRIRGCGR